MTKAEKMINLLEATKLMTEFATKQEVIDNLAKVCEVDNAGDIAYKTIFEQFMAMSAILHVQVAIDAIIRGVKNHAEHYNAN